MEIKRYRFNRKSGKIFQEQGEKLLETENLRVIILWASEPKFAQPFPHLAAQYWVQLTFIDSESNFCYAMLNNGSTEALSSWFDYKNEISQRGLTLREVITRIELTEIEKEVFHYSFHGLPAKPSLKEKIDNLLNENKYPLIDLSIQY
ncbi:MAG: hypothetical protein ACKO9U_25915 [Dolichospermum sp.]